MITNVQECIKPISYVKTNAADMMNFVNDKKIMARKPNKAYNLQSFTF